MHASMSIYVHHTPTPDIEHHDSLLGAQCACSLDVDALVSLTLHSMVPCSHKAIMRTREGPRQRCGSMQAAALREPPAHPERSCMAADSHQWLACASNCSTFNRSISKLCPIMKI